MRIRIDGRELVVKKSTRGLVALQQQTGWKLEEIDEHAKQGYGAAMSAFLALTNAGFTPVWEDLLDRDIAEFEFVKEPGDDRLMQAADAADPQNSRADSDPGGDTATPAAMS